jgi:hypothetical protein
MRAHSLGVGDSFDEVAEELAPVALTAPVGVLALALQDSDELRTGLEEPTPLATSVMRIRSTPRDFAIVSASLRDRPTSLDHSSRL